MFLAGPLFPKLVQLITDCLQKTDMEFIYCIIFITEKPC